MIRNLLCQDVNWNKFKPGLLKRFWLNCGKHSTLVVLPLGKDCFSLFFPSHYGFRWETSYLYPPLPGFPGGSEGKESACSVGELGSISGLGRSPGEGNDYPLQYSGLENSMDCIVQGVAKSQTRLSDFLFHFSLTGSGYHKSIQRVPDLKATPGLEEACAEQQSGRRSGPGCSASAHDLAGTTEPEEPSWGWETAFMFPNLSRQLGMWCGETEMWITTPAKVDALRRVISGWRFMWHSLALWAHRGSWFN